MKNFLYFTGFIISILIIRIFFIDIVSITSHSMVPSLWPSEWVIVIKDRDIKRGDIITFYDKNSSDIYIKRVMGIKGDQISYIDDMVTINGSIISQQKVQLNRQLPEELKERDFKSFVEVLGNKKYSILIDQDKSNHNIENLRIKNQYFVLGDNRNHSKDSRDFGLVSTKKVIGKAVLTIYSNGKLFKPL